MERAMYSSTEIDRIQREEKAAYVKSLEEQGLCEYKGQIIPIDEYADYVIADNERELDTIYDWIEEDGYY